MIKERRKHPRLRIPLEAEYLVAGRDEWRQGTIWTLGAGGAALLCEEQLDKGRVLEGLRFLVEAEGDLPETRIEVGAKVVSIDRKADFGRPSNFMLGLQFTGLGETEFELVKQFVFRRLTGPQRSPRDAEGGKETESAPPIEIRFKLFDEFVEEVSDNLSPSGMFIRAHRPLPPGSRFVFQFQLGEDFSLFHGSAEVVWTRRRSEGPDRPPGMGVRFLKLDLTSQKLVKRLVGQRGDGDEEHGEEQPGLAAAAAKKGGGAALKLSQEAEPFALAEDGESAAESQPEPESESKGKARAARLERRLAKVEKQLDEARSSRDEAEQKALRLGDASEALREENKELQASFEEAEEARGRAEAEATELRGELDTRRPDEEIEAQQLAAREELERRQEEWQKLEAELRGDVERTSAAETELRASLESAVETEAALRQQLEQADGRESELRARLEQVDADREELERQTERADEAESSLQQLRQETGESRREWEATEAELRAQLEQKSGESVELEERLAEAVGAEAELRQRLSELRAARDEMEQKVARGAEVEAELGEQARELREARSELEARLARSTTQLERMRGAAEQMRSRFNGDLSEAQALGEDLADRMTEVAEVRSGLDEKVSRLNAARASLADRLTRINAAWSSLESGLEEMEPEGHSAALVEPGESSAAEGEAAFEPEPAELVESEVAELVESEVAELVESEVAESFESEVTEPVEPEPAEPVGSEVAELEAAERIDRDEAGEVEAVAPEPAEVAEPEAVPESREFEREMAELDAAGTVEEPGDEAAEAPDERSEAMVEPDEASVAAEPPQQPERSGAGGLLGVARRAVARLGFGRKSAGGNGDVPYLPQVLEDKTEPVEVEEPATPEAIEETVRAWAAAWSERRVEDYLSFYSSDFEPAEPDEEADPGDSPQAWLPPLAGMELTLGPISQTEMEPGRFAVQFEQSVESDSYTRRTGRTLEMVLEADAWKIAAESFQDLPNW